MPDQRASQDVWSMPLAVVGNGRAGGSLACAARDAGLEVRLAGRGEVAEACAGAGVALICVGDDEIDEACEDVVAAGAPPYVGHVSGATPLIVLGPASDAGAEAFSMHPLQTIPDAETDLAGVPCAVSGLSPAALAFAEELAARVGLRPFRLDDSARTTYHAAASMASNFLVALEESAAGLLARTGVDDARELLAPLVLRTAANWADRGAEALTGPIARGDEATVARHVDALRSTAPELLPLYEALADRTRELAAARTAR
jgi:predicted short-subunit dehydrogenase-like oxidoreductase (DUF2520 family)